jgi:hypothetical protein
MGKLAWNRLHSCGHGGMSVHRSAERVREELVGQLSVGGRELVPAWPDAYGDVIPPARGEFTGNVCGASAPHVVRAGDEEIPAGSGRGQHVLDVVRAGEARYDKVA